MMCVVITALKMNFHILSGKDPFAVFAEASILTNCKIQTLCVKTNIRVSFTPPEVMDEDCLKILYYHHENFTMCQRVVDIRMNKENKDSSQPDSFEPDLSKVERHWQLSRDYFVVYGYDYSQGVYEVEIHTNLSLLQKFERFFEKIPHESSIAFIYPKASLFRIFVKAFLRRLGRKPPIDATNDGELVKKM